jgi:prephenate dehydrogenase
MDAHFNDTRVCIIGLGLMGGSLGMALKAHGVGRTISGADSQAAVLRQAIALEAVDEATTDVARAARRADIIVLATPVRTIIRLCAEIGPHLQPDTLLLDLGSTKTAVVEAMAKLPSHVQVVGGHPMCGKEKTGIAAADPELYKGAVFCLTPLERTRPEALARAEALVRAIGAHPLVMDCQRHDAVVAATSHLPYLMATALTATAADLAAHDDLVWQVVATGFRDTSRLAGSDVDMMMDILLTNPKNVAGRARDAAQKLLDMAAAIDTGNEAILRQFLVQTQQTWCGVYP